ncbi:MAG: hypothetical protein WDN44_01200 [Sphingomonas sp.]
MTAGPALGCDGWGYDDVLPVFRRAENNQRLAGPYHGKRRAIAGL